MNKNLCVPDNDANILRFLSIAGGNATTETGEFWMDLDAYPSLDLCPGRTRAAPWKLAAPLLHLSTAASQPAIACAAGSFQRAT